MITRRQCRLALACVGLLSCGERLAAQQAAERTPSTTFRECPVCPELVVLAAGTVRAFALGKDDVRRAEYERFVRETGYPVSDAATLTRQDARAYVAWLNDKVRRRGTRPGEGPYRLPTEAEWEYAARLYPAWLLARTTGEGAGDAGMGFRVARTVSPLVDQVGMDLRRYMRAAAPRIILEHVWVVDGTGAAAVDDRNVTIEQGTISDFSYGADVLPADSTIVLHLRGYSLMPLRFEVGAPALRAIRRALLDPATFVGLGRIDVGETADFMVIRGDPTTGIAAIEDVEIVFKGGIGYDARKVFGR